MENITLDLESVLPHLTERGRLEWELAVTKAQLAQQIARNVELAKQISEKEGQQ